MGSKWICTFCGEKANSCRVGSVYWCNADHCRYLAECSESEPILFPWMAPTPTQQLIGLLQYWGFRCLYFVPCIWLTLPGGWRSRVAAWVYGGSYFSECRWEGIV